jgi:hypothetical protein
MKAAYRTYRGQVVLAGPLGGHAVDVETLGRMFAPSWAFRCPLDPGTGVVVTIETDRLGQRIVDLAVTAGRPARTPAPAPRRPMPTPRDRQAPPAVRRRLRELDRAIEQARREQRLRPQLYSGGTNTASGSSR